MQTKSPQYRTFWPEMVEAEPFLSKLVPAWSALEAQAVAVRQILMREEDNGTPVNVGEFTPHRRTFGEVPNRIPAREFDLHNIHCFGALPLINDIRNTIADNVTKSVRHLVSSALLPGIREQVLQEQTHTLYHHAMWRRYGRRVYVLDETTYTLLAETELPDLPVSILGVSEHSFYLALPKNAFTFGVWNLYAKQEDVQPIEGVLVSIDKLDPDYPGVRTLSFVAIGAGDDLEERNIAYISVSMGADALLSDVRFGDANTPFDPMAGIELAKDQGRLTAEETKAFANPLNSGSYELGVTIPRIILGFILYLASEHPDIEPIPPAPRRTFSEIRSPRQRAAALGNQAAKLKNATRLPILYVGRHLAEEVEEERRKLQLAGFDTTNTGRALDHPVWVRGHWKRQPFGIGRKERRTIWIRPYLKGPDIVDSLKARAAKVQRAQPVREE